VPVVDSGSALGLPQPSDDGELEVPEEPGIFDVPDESLVPLLPVVPLLPLEEYPPDGYEYVSLEELPCIPGDVLDPDDVPAASIEPELPCMPLISLAPLDDGGTVELDELDPLNPELPDELVP
jgi:hypothetical protein